MTRPLSNPSRTLTCKLRNFYNILQRNSTPWVNVKTSGFNQTLRLWIEGRMLLHQDIPHNDKSKDIPLNTTVDVFYKHISGSF